MLLRNYDVLQATISLPYLQNKTYYTDKAFEDGKLCFKNQYGNIYQVARNTSAASSSPCIGMENSAIGYSPNNLICGSGTTAATYDDYCLENIFTTSQVQNLSHKSSEVFYDEENKTFSVTYSKTFLALENIVVSEIGITSPYINRDTDRAKVDCCLIYREVYETPVIIPANSNFVISFTITVSANQNKPADYSSLISIE